VQYYLGTPEQQEKRVRLLAKITGRTIVKPVPLPAGGMPPYPLMEPGMPAAGHPLLGQMGAWNDPPANPYFYHHYHHHHHHHHHPIPPPPWALDADPDSDSDDFLQSRGGSQVRVYIFPIPPHPFFSIQPRDQRIFFFAIGVMFKQDTPLSLAHQLVMVSMIMNFSLQETAHIHDLIKSFPENILPSLPYLLSTRLHTSLRYPPCAYYRLALALVHSELVVSPRINPDIVLLVSCPQECSFHGLTSFVEGGNGCEGRHTITVHSIILNNIPTLEDQASRLLSQRPFQRPTDLDHSPPPPLTIDCQPFALETCEFIIHFVKYGLLPPDKLSLGTVGPTAVGSVIHLATYWEVAKVLDACEDFIAEQLKTQVS